MRDTPWRRIQCRGRVLPTGPSPPTDPAGPRWSALNLSCILHFIPPPRPAKGHPPTTTHLAILPKVFLTQQFILVENATLQKYLQCHRQQQWSNANFLDDRCTVLNTISYVSIPSFGIPPHFYHPILLPNHHTFLTPGKETHMTYKMPNTGMSLACNPDVKEAHTPKISRLEELSTGRFRTKNIKRILQMPGRFFDFLDANASCEQFNWNEKIHIKDRHRMIYRKRGTRCTAIGEGLSSTPPKIVHFLQPCAVFAALQGNVQ